MDPDRSTRKVIRTPTATWRATMGSVKREDRSHIVGTVGRWVMWQPHAKLLRQETHVILVQGETLLRPKPPWTQQVQSHKKASGTQGPGPPPANIHTASSTTDPRQYLLPDSDREGEVVRVIEVQVPDKGSRSQLVQ